MTRDFLATPDQSSPGALSVFCTMGLGAVSKR